METSDFYAVLGHRIQSRRKELGIVTVKLAQKLNISQQQISRYENGLTNFNIVILFRFFSSLGMTSEEVVRIFKELGLFYSDLNMSQYQKLRIKEGS